MIDTPPPATARFHVGAGLLAAAILATALACWWVGPIARWKLSADCSALGVDRMVQAPSDDEQHRLYMRCLRGK